MNPHADLKLVNLQQDLECQNYSQEFYVERELDCALVILRAASNLSNFTAAMYVGLLSDKEPITDGVLDVSALSILEGLTLPKGKLVASGFYTGYVPPSCVPGQRIRFHLTLACKPRDL
jgi:hypothetical protein